MKINTGRPTTDPKESVINVRLNEEMHKWVADMSNKHNQSKSEYIRNLIRKDMLQKI